MSFSNKLKELTKITLIEDEQDSSDANAFPYYAIEVSSDFEGNVIPKQYRTSPIYLAKSGKRVYPTKTLERGISLFDNDTPGIYDDVAMMYPELKISKKTEFPKGVIDSINAELNPTKKELDNEVIIDPIQKNVDLAKSKDKHPDMVVPDSRVLPHATLVDTREIEEYIHNGIHPNIVYASNPKPAWWYDNEKGEHHLIRLYGITTSVGDENMVVVKELLPFSNNDGYLKQEEGDSFLMPISKFKEIIHNDYNKETYDELMKNVPEDEQDDPDLWLDEVLDKKRKMLARFEKWKEENDFKYDLSKYTKSSLIKVYNATTGSWQLPIEKALELYGKKIEDLNNAKFLKAFTDWKVANNKEYDLDRFSDEDLYSVFADVYYNGEDIDSALIKNIDDNAEETEEEDFVEESVSLEEAPRSPDDLRSKNWIISKPNELRDILNKLGIDPIYASNPFEVKYKGLSGKDSENKFDKPDRRYMIVGIRRPDLKTKIEDINPDDLSIAYIKDWDLKGARPQAIYLNDLEDMLLKAEQPTLWTRYRTYKDQKRPLNRGSYYIYVDVPEEVVIEALTEKEKQDPFYTGYNLVGLYQKALKDHEENRFVTNALRSYAKGVSIRLKGQADSFRGYQYAQDTRTGKPTQAKFSGGSKNPYTFLMKNF